MKPHLIWFSGIGAVAAVFLLLALPGLSAPPEHVTAQSPETAPADFDPDPRWLSLLHSSHPNLLRLQAAAPSVNVHLTDRFVAGRVGLASSVTVSVTRAGARIAHAVAAPIPDVGGFFYLTQLTWAGAAYGSGGSCGGGAFQPGDVVWVAQAGLVTTMTIPTLNGLADAPTDVISGSAPPSQTVTLYLFPSVDSTATYTRTATSNEAGTYQAQWAPEVDLRPGDSGYILYAESPDRRAYVRFVTPVLRVQVAGMEISGLAAPCSEVEITLYDSEGGIRSGWWTWAEANGRFYLSEYWEKEATPLRPGDRVLALAAGQTFSTTVLAVTAHTDLSGGKVWGEAPAGAPVSVMRFAGPLSYGWDNLWDQLPTGQALVTATAPGLYTASLPLTRTDYGAACAFSPEGHQTCARFAVPYLRVRMGESRTPGGSLLAYEAEGQIDAPSAPLTIAIQSARGYPRDIRRLTAAGNGYFRDTLDYGQSLALDTGDVLTLTTPQGVRVALVLPLLTAEAHPLSDTVSGQAPPGTRLIVSILYDEYPIAPPPPGALGGGPAPPPPYYGYAVRVVTATAEGRYLADFSGEVDITSVTVGEVAMSTPEGHTVARAFRTVLGCRPTLTSVQVNGNYLGGFSDYHCPTLTLRLRDALGVLKAERVFDFSWRPSFEAYLYLYEVHPGEKEHPIPIRAGDMIELESAGQILTTTVPSLTVTLDPRGDVISGLAPPDTLLYLTVYNYGRLTTTVGAQGVYSVSLAGEYDLTAGDQVHVRYAQDGTWFFTLGAVPFFRAGLYQYWLSGLLPPITPYTVSLGSMHIAAVGYANSDGWWSTNLITRLVPGDIVTVTMPGGFRALTLPFLSAQVDRATATVSGQAPANARLRVDVETLQYIYRSREVTATAAGTYTVSFPDLAPLALIQGVLTYFDPEGDQVSLFFANRQWHVILGQPCVWGYADMVGVPFTATLQAGDAPLDSAFGGTSDWSGYFYGCFDRAIRSGDRLTLLQPGATFSFTVPVLTARHEYAQQLLEGEAPVGSFLEAVFYTASGSAVRRTQAGPSGRYVLDTTGLNLRPGSGGYVRMTDGDGSTVDAGFIIRGYPVYLPLVHK